MTVCARSYRYRYLDNVQDNVQICKSARHHLSETKNFFSFTHNFFVLKYTQSCTFVYNKKK